jgi:hypothetical protein
MHFMRPISKTHLLAFAAFLIVASGYGHAQSAFYNAANNYLKKRADAFMTITGYSLTPDVTTGSLSIRNNGGDNSDLQMISLGGGDRISANFPLYFEGTLAVNRYNPTFGDGIGNTSVTVPVHWNSVTGTGGIGWDFPITDELRFRPIANVMLGHLESDLYSLASDSKSERRGFAVSQWRPNEFIRPWRLINAGL